MSSPSPPGHDPGHPTLHPAAAGVLPLSWDWQQIVDLRAAERGGLAELARHLQDVAPASARLSDDPQTVERGLRRLRQHHGDGGRYGKLLLRCLGLPDTMLNWARQLGQYHSRASDLPLPMRHDLLQRWDCPPMSTSAAAIWIHIGLASIALQRRDLPQTRHRLDLARLFLKRAEPDARLEFELLAARIVSRPDPAAAAHHLDRAADILQAAPLPPSPQACYDARLLDQRAFLASQGWRSHPERLQHALDLYDAIDDSPDAPPFAAFRREHGRAWSLWRQGHTQDALIAAQKACSHAGDGGLIRFRLMSLVLQSHILPAGPLRAATRHRADLLSRSLDP